MSEVDIEVTSPDFDLAASLAQIPADKYYYYTINADVKIDSETLVTVPRGTEITISEGYSVTISERTVVDLIGFIDNTEGELILEGFINEVTQIYEPSYVTGYPEVSGEEYVISSAMDLQWLEVILLDEEYYSFSCISMANDIEMPNVRFATIR